MRMSAIATRMGALLFMIIWEAVGIGARIVLPGCQSGIWQPAVTHMVPSRADAKYVNAGYLRNASPGYIALNDLDDVFLISYNDTVTIFLPKDECQCQVPVQSSESFIMQSNGDFLSAASNAANAFSRKPCSMPRIPNTTDSCSAVNVSCGCQTSFTTKPTDEFPFPGTRRCMSDWLVISAATRQSR